MDFIRYELLFRSKLFDNTVKKGMYAVLGSQKLIYKKPLKVWTNFDITLQLEGWDENWAYHKHVIKQGDEICCLGYTKLAFWKDKKAQSMEGIIKNCGYNEIPVSPPQSVLNLFDSDYELLHERKAGDI